MAFIKIPQGSEPGFATVVNTDLVTHATTTVGDEGGTITFFTTGGEKFSYSFSAGNKAIAAKMMADYMKNFFNAKDVDAQSYKGLL